MFEPLYVIGFLLKSAIFLNQELIENPEMMDNSQQIIREYVVNRIIYIRFLKSPDCDLYFCNRFRVVNLVKQQLINY